MSGREPGEGGVVATSPADLPPAAVVVLPARAVASLSVEGAAVVRCGAAAAERDAPRSRRPGWAWWLWVLASQVILIALPEEVFYRGWLQQRLRRIWPGGLPAFGVRVGPAILATSVLFALGHVVTMPAAFRLAVFFPSILFGWLRDRTGHLAGSVAFHVLSNLAMLTVMRFYA
jgi:membrane protease YdiL (CAAX protease family)